MMRIQVRIVGNLPLVVKGLQRQYELELPAASTMADLLCKSNIKAKVFALNDGKRLEAGDELHDGMEITIISPAVGG